MTVYSYVIKRDYGFAPNPYFGFCSLATCKPSIRNNAKVGDWVIANGKSTSKCRDSLIYCMQVSKVITYNDYWFGEEFSCKKPDMNSSLKKMFGDNIYHYDHNDWQQADSHHSLDDGSPNPKNIETDTKSDKVLISYNYHYFGKNCFEIPEKYRQELICRKIGHSKPNPELFLEFYKNYLSGLDGGYYDDPYEFSKGFARYDGL